MAPRQRSSKAGRQAIQKLLSSGIAVNTHGLPALPNELYSEILSHMPAFPIPHDVWVDKKPDPYRQLTLYYLSQTCRSLRKFFLRYAWEQIEVFGGIWTPKGRLPTKAERSGRGMGMKELGEKQMVEEIFRQLETVTVRHPALQQFVSSVNLTIMRYSNDVVVPKIAQGLSLFPNLHTLQLVFLLDYPRPQQFFSAFRYPNVRTLNLSRMSPVVDILLACPNTKRFSYYKDLGDSYNNRIQNWLSCECAGGLEKLGIQPNLEMNIAAVAKHLPQLRDVSLSCQNLRTLVNFDPLSSLPLHTIRLRLDDYHQGYLSEFMRILPPAPNECLGWIDLAKRILAKCPQDDSVVKKVIVVNYDKTVDVYGV